MAVTLPIKYFNTFLISEKPYLDMKRFLEIESDRYPFHIEESRIRGEFNGTSVDFGVKAYVVDEEYQEQTRYASMIYSGVFNSKTGVNNTNEFSIGENTIKDIDIYNGSIQKLYAENTNLIILQEDKVSRALIDKDALFSADGGGTVTSTKSVIGQVVPYLGKYGISKHPESFAVFGDDKYWADKNRGVYCRLAQDGITEISDYGLRSFFRRSLPNVERIYGMYDFHHHAYITSMNYGVVNGDELYDTLNFDETLNGWVSFHDYAPVFGGGLNGIFYTFKRGELWQHYINETRNNFYDENYKSSVTFVVNNSPSSVKYFKTISYEGSEGWEMTNAYTDTDNAYSIPSYLDPGYTDPSTGINYKSGFDKRENKYFSWIRNNNTNKQGEVLDGSSISGIKGFFNTVTLTNSLSTYQELFAVSHDLEQSST